MHLNWKTLLCAGLLVATGVQAESIGDYRNQALLQTEGKATWYRLDIPMSVYWASAHADLRDLRVFNAAGEALPYALTASEERRIATYREANARFFPLYGSASGASAQEGLSVRVRRDANGVLVEVLSDNRQTVPSDAPLRGWLLDVSTLDFPLERLRLDWKNGVEGFQRFRIEASDDLEHWQHWGEGQIARLDFEGERIERNEIRLPNGKTRYLRLTWLTPEVAAILNAATLIGVQSGYKPAPLLWSQPIVGSATKNAGEFIWQLPLRLPLERLHVAVSEPNTLAPVIVSGAWRTAEPEADARLGIKKRPRQREDLWQTLARGLLYRLPIESGEDVQEEINLSGAAVNQLRLQVDSRGGGLWQKAGQQPQLRVAIYGHQLVFLARGEPPYRLAFGRADAQSAELPLTTLAPAYDSSQPEKVKFGSAHLADNASIAAPVTSSPAAPESSEESNAYVFWIVLLAGVGLLAGMAISLLRGDKQEGK